jgi:hypothetical protein
MLVFGPFSSVFDFLTSYVLLHPFGGGEALFQTGRFIDSITTQVLWWSSPSGRGGLSFEAGRICFSPPRHLELLLWQSRSRCSPASAGGQGFVAPPPLFFVFLMGATLAYLAIVEITKRVFYRDAAGQSPWSQSLG